MLYYINIKYNLNIKSISILNVFIINNTIKDYKNKTCFFKHVL